jgi:hypothetical protein
MRAGLRAGLDDDLLERTRRENRELLTSLGLGTLVALLALLLLL